MEKDFKLEFVNFMLDSYKAYNWVRNANTQEVTTQFNDYKIRLASSRDGSFLQVFKGDNDYLGKSINAKDYPIVSDLISRVWKHITYQSENKFWCDTLDFFKKHTLTEK